MKFFIRGREFFEIQVIHCKRKGKLGGKCIPQRFEARKPLDDPLFPSQTALILQCGVCLQIGGLYAAHGYGEWTARLVEPNKLDTEIFP